jgi:hypothetical protein
MTTKVGFLTQAGPLQLRRPGKLVTLAGMSLALFSALVLPIFGPGGRGMGIAAAQPAMPDPSQMSGIPRQDPAVATGTITVRLIRGELTNRIVGTEVQLVSLQDGAEAKLAPRIEKTDAEGRATFSGVPVGSYEARAVVDTEALVSQPMEVQPAPAPGVRVMLVFSKSVAEQQKELGTPDGKTRIDQGQPPGVLLVKTLDEQGQPIAGLKVSLFRANRQNEQVETLPEQTTGADGIAKFTDQKSGPEYGYMASVKRDGTEQRTSPFRLVAEHGSSVALTVKAVAQGQAAVGQLQIGMGSHLIMELQDDSVQVLENLRLVNALPQAVDPGPTGLRIPLAEGAMSAQVVPGGPVNVSIDSSGDGPPVAVWKGPIPAGDSEVRVAFLMRHRGNINFRQAVTVPVQGLRLIMEQLPEIRVEDVAEQESRKFQGRDLVLATLKAPAPGGFIAFKVQGLPAEMMTVRYLAGVLAAVIALLFTYLAMSGRAAVEEANKRRRQKLEHQRETLLAAILQNEERALKGDAGDAGKKAKPTAELMSKLEEVYRLLDELDAS